MCLLDEYFNVDELDTMSAEETLDFAYKNITCDVFSFQKNSESYINYGDSEQTMEIISMHDMIVST